jgi:putative transcriptional regulator
MSANKNLRLKAARAAKDMTQQDLADKCKVSRQTINAIELGEYNPTIRLCIAICRVLDKTLNDLFWEEESMGVGGTIRMFMGKK